MCPDIVSLPSVVVFLPGVFLEITGIFDCYVRGECMSGTDEAVFDEQLVWVYAG